MWHNASRAQAALTETLPGTHIKDISINLPQTTQPILKSQLTSHFTTLGRTVENIFCQLPFIKERTNELTFDYFPCPPPFIKDKWTDSWQHIPVGYSWQFCDFCVQVHPGELPQGLTVYLYMCKCRPVNVYCNCVNVYVNCLCVCMYVYMYVYMYVCAHCLPSLTGRTIPQIHCACVYIQKHCVCIWMYVYLYVHTLCICIYTHAQRCTYTHVQTKVFTGSSLLHAHTLSLTRTYIHTYTHT